MAAQTEMSKLKEGASEILTVIGLDVVEATRDRDEGPPVVDSPTPSQDGAPFPWKSILCVFAICLGSFVFGTVTTYPSPAMANLNDHPNPFHVNNEQNSWVGSVVPLGALVGGMTGGMIMDSVGRNMALVACAVPFAFGWILVVAAPAFSCLLVGRALTGICTGIYSQVVPVFIGEVSPPAIRGLLGSCHQLVIGFGILYTYGFGAFLSWQWLGVACAALLPVLAFVLCLVPDSPRWLLASRTEEDARVALEWLRGKGANVEKELGELRQAALEAEDKASWREFGRPELLKPLLISIGLMVFQQFSGVNVVLFYTVQIFQMARINLDPNLQSIIVGVVGIVGTAISILVIDLAGRKVLLLVSSVMMTISMAGMGAFFYVLEDQGKLDYATTTLSWLPITCLVVYYFGYNLAFGAIPWITMGELFPLRAKGMASSIVTATSWLLAFLITKFFVNVTAAIGNSGGFWIFAAFGALSVPFVIFVVPETKGRTLEEIVASFK